MTKTQNKVVVPTRVTWRSMIDKLQVGGELLIPKAKFNSVSNIVSTKFHELTHKRFSVTYKDSPKNQAKVTRLADVKQEAAIN